MTQQLTNPPAAELKRAISFEQFLSDPSVPEHSEWVAGEVIPMAPVSDEHNDIGLFLLAAMRVYSELKDVGVVRSEPFQMRAAPDLPSRAPDVIFVSKANLGRVRHNFLDGPADVAVEIVSPSSLARDRGEKFDEYERGGVSEYWLIDPLRRECAFYELGEGRVYRVAQLQDGAFHSTALPGFRLRPEWLWQSPRPAVISVLKELGVI